MLNFYSIFFKILKIFFPVVRACAPMSISVCLGHMQRDMSSPCTVSLTRMDLVKTEYAVYSVFMTNLTALGPC
jgi:hypothetical protein